MAEQDLQWRSGSSARETIQSTLNDFLHPNPIITFSIAFFSLGLLNNSLYVVILTSALELLPQGAPTGLVALANIGPALIAKAIWPYLLKGRVRYAKRVASCTVLSMVGMLIIAFIPTIGARLFGISMASFSSGLGELTFLQLCTRYGPLRAGRGVGWFASGTGAAGLFGAGAWWVVRPLGVRGGLSLMSVLPLFMAAAYFLLMPSVEKIKEFETATLLSGGNGYSAVPTSADFEDEDSVEADPEADEVGINRRNSTSRSGSEIVDSLGPLHAPTLPAVLPRELDETIPEGKTVKLSFSDKMDLLRPMLVPFILPLVLVYLIEYTINQGIAPTLLYPVPDASKHLILSWMIKSLHDYYPLYQLTYQAFVFLSRSSLSLLHIPPIPRSLLWLPAMAQFSIFCILTSESLFFWFKDSIARSLVIVLVGVEGLAGGWAYVSVFYQIGTTQRQANTSTDLASTTNGEADQAEDALDLARRGQEQEFRVGCVGVGDSMGILVASLISMPIQLGLCAAQVSSGRDLCKQV